LKRVLFTALVLLVPASAAAEPKDACIVAYEQTQTLRKDGKLVSARAEAAVCAREACPSLLTKDCTRWLHELEASTPSVVLEARNEAGAALGDVQVTVDGVVLATQLDGKPIAIDPGKHVFRFESGGATSSETVLVREGEKNRRIRATLATRAEQDAPPPEGRHVPAGVWIFGGASIVALGVSAGFAIDGLAKKGSLDECRPRCAPSDVDAMSASFTVADVALGAGVMAAVTAAYLFFTRPKGPDQPRPLAGAMRAGRPGALTIPF
jgi:hypothetical protein